MSKEALKEYYQSQDLSGVEYRLLGLIKIDNEEITTTEQVDEYING
jgi:hypothetical protein